MRLEQLIDHFEHSPAVRLLRAQNAPYVVQFLSDQFRSGGRIVIPHSDLLAALRSFQDSIPKAFGDKAEVYLADWCSNEKRWLRRTLDFDRSEPHYQLTPVTEAVFEFLERTMDTTGNFVGPETRLTHIVETLEELVVGSSPDPTVHIEHLEAERDRIDEQIRYLKTAEQPVEWSDSRIREQFSWAVTVFKELQRDFRVVEERFREIARDVQQRQIQGWGSRSGILEDALSAEDSLRQDEHGASFFAFFRLIQTPDQQERLRSLVGELKRMPSLADAKHEVETLRQIVPVLLAEANQVMQTERRLSASLRRLLDQRSGREHQQLTELLQEIKGLVVELKDEPLEDVFYLEIDESIPLSSPTSRMFWTPPPTFEVVDLVDSVLDSQAVQKQFESFTRMQRIDFAALRQTIRQTVKDDGPTTLAELLVEHPPTGGVLDVLAYLQIANDDGHTIDSESSEDVVIQLPEINRPVKITVPEVTFVSHKEWD
ncbi:DUF3375 domain-containing protein [Thalassoroseus pseudoceratinae]|uniref:DUF3375 domain-containing protein n=1 Tax=Thalassoroseus pseudoceratinae TaxID=2713176 RepID=UPI0014209C79|nr:DUF3375 domain-containing protein [Thalassoroseus pseudoceratinae]